MKPLFFNILTLLGLVLIISSCDNNKVQKETNSQNKAIAQETTKIEHAKSSSWNFQGRYIIIYTESKTKQDIELIVENNKIKGKTFYIDPYNNLSWIEISGEIKDNGEFYFKESNYSNDANGQKVYYEMVNSYNGRVLSKDHMEGKLDDYLPVSIISQNLISNYQPQNNGGQQNDQTSIYDDTKEFTRSTADALKLGWEIMNDPVGSAERIVNDDEYSKNLERTTEDMLNSSEKMNERLENASTKIQNLLNKNK